MATEVFRGMEKEASRLELFIRIPYYIIVAIVMFIYGIVIGIWGWLVGIIVVLHWIYSLILGKRWDFANKHTTKFVNFAFGRFYFDYIIKKVVPYFMLLTDNRPGFTI